MEFISLVFRLGVVLAIFSFIWGIIQFGLTVLRGGIPLSYPVALIFKMVQYLLIADITILFCGTETDASQAHTVLSGFILLMYFVGKVQNLQYKFMIVQIQGRNMNLPQKLNMNLELGIIGLSMGLFVLLVFMPQYAVNPATEWFYRNITDIEKNAFFGFIFKFIGFFFTVNILFRMVGAFTFILSGKAFGRGPQQNDGQPDNRSDDRFDDYEELK